jgi:hypothetical protein
MSADRLRPGTVHQVKKWAPLVAVLAVLVGATSAVLLSSADSSDPVLVAGTEPSATTSGYLPGSYQPELSAASAVAQDGEVGDFTTEGFPRFDVRATLVEIAETKGAKLASETLNTWADENYEFGKACHNEAHLLGSTSARIDDPKVVVKYATSRCDYGYVHGVLKATALDSNPNSDPNLLADLCLSAIAEIQPNCEHGLGHAVPLRDNLTMTQSFEMCSKLTTESRQSQCVTGAAMEFGVNDMIFHDLRSMDPGSLDKSGNLKRLPISAAERSKPCAALEGKASFSALDVCYRHVHYFWSGELGEDYTTFADRCKPFTMDTNGSCYQSLGAWVWYEDELDASDPLETHKALLDRSCMTLKLDAARNGCLHGYMHTIWQVEKNAANMPSLCDRLGRKYEPGCMDGEDRFRNPVAVDPSQITNG